MFILVTKSFAFGDKSGKYRIKSGFFSENEFKLLFLLTIEVPVFVMQWLKFQLPRLEK